MKKEIERYKNFEYIITRPRNFSPEKTYPMILLLHGAGARGNDISLHLNYPLFKLGEEMIRDAIVVMPQCFDDTWFDIFEQLKEFAVYAMEQLNADPCRCYVMGASMGAYATWQMAMSMPERFAAAVPICGGGMYWNAERLKNMPIHAFHGCEDPIVLCEESKKMVDAINKRGGNAKLTLLEGVGHNAWDYAYRDQALFAWLFSKKLEK